MAQPGAVLTEPKQNKAVIKTDKKIEKEFESTVINRTVKIAAKENFVIIDNRKYPASRLLNSFYNSRKYNLA